MCSAIRAYMFLNLLLLPFNKSIQKLKTKQYSLNLQFWLTKGPNRPTQKKLIVWSSQTILLWIVWELAGVGFVAVIFLFVTGDTQHITHEI